MEFLPKSDSQWVQWTHKLCPVGEIYLEIGSTPALVVRPVE